MEEKRPPVSHLRGMPNLRLKEKVSRKGGRKEDANKQQMLYADSHEEAAQKMTDLVCNPPLSLHL